MSDVTRILKSIEDGNRKAADELLPLVYDELRKLAAVQSARENPGQGLSASSLVHEAYLRLVDVEEAQQWDSRGHFFAAAAEAMRRILIENARRKKAAKHGGGLQRVDLERVEIVVDHPPEEMLALDEALEKLAGENAAAAQAAKLRLFAGLSVQETADVLGVSRTTAYRRWIYARAWLRAELRDPESGGE